MRVNVTLQRLYPRGKDLWYSLNRTAECVTEWLQTFRTREIHLTPTENRTQYVSCKLFSNTTSKVGAWGSVVRY